MLYARNEPEMEILFSWNFCLESRNRPNLTSIRCYEVKFMTKVKLFQLESYIGWDKLPLMHNNQLIFRLTCSNYFTYIFLYTSRPWKNTMFPAQHKYLCPTFYPKACLQYIKISSTLFLQISIFCIYLHCCSIFNACNWPVEFFLEIQKKNISYHLRSLFGSLFAENKLYYLISIIIWWCPCPQALYWPLMARDVVHLSCNLVSCTWAPSVFVVMHPSVVCTWDISTKYCTFTNLEVFLEYLWIFKSIEVLWCPAAWFLSKHMDSISNTNLSKMLKFATSLGL